MHQRAEVVLMVKRKKPACSQPTHVYSSLQVNNSIKHIILNTYYFLIGLSVFICPILVDRSIIVHLFINKQVCIMNSFSINLTDCVRVHMFKLITSQDSCTCTSEILSISKWYHNCMKCVPCIGVTWFYQTF